MPDRDASLSEIAQNCGLAYTVTFSDAIGAHACPVEFRDLIER
jgi:hypothetical protein